MDDQDERKRVGWTTRINLRPREQEAIRCIANRERISVATMIGLAIENFVTARSTA